MVAVYGHPGETRPDKLPKLPSLKDLYSGAELATEQAKEPDMQFPEHIGVMVGMIAALAACIIGLACIAIGAVLTEPEKDAHLHATERRATAL
jgi:hypothetical protein